MKKMPPWRLANFVSIKLRSSTWGFQTSQTAWKYHTSNSSNRMTLLSWALYFGSDDGGSTNTYMNGFRELCHWGMFSNTRKAFVKWLNREKKYMNTHLQTSLMKTHPASFTPYKNRSFFPMAAGSGSPIKWGSRFSIMCLLAKVYLC